MNEREALERIAKYPMSRSEEMSIETARDIARAAIASQAQQSQWISVEERLPEIGEEVIVFKPKSERHKVTALARFIRYEEDTEYYWEVLVGRGNMALKGSVTHWMPLPLPPAPEGEKE